MKKSLMFLLMLMVVGSVPVLTRADVRDRIFDFTDQYYAQNGVDIAKIFNRRQVTGNGNSVFDNPNFSFQRNVRASRLNPAYSDNGTPTFWAVMGDLDNGGFLNNRAGQRARDIANSYILYVFPTRTGNQIGLGNNRQADIVDLRGGYFSNDPLGLWLHVWVSYTDAAFNTREGQKQLTQLQRKNGLAADGTPIIKTLSELNNLLDKGLARKRFRNPDGSEGPMYGICPVIKDPTDGGIVVIDTLAQVRVNGEPLEPELLRQFDSLRLIGDWANN
ncbi:MAG TPA: hypothetical protein VGO50_21255 [Pyrinomonadaceae bacterium]|jgi:hypothetical protein|nr:hypothetical protein [Pyrinomonadaceae bacterium]